MSEPTKSDMVGAFLDRALAAITALQNDLAEIRTAQKMDARELARLEADAAATRAALTQVQQWMAQARIRVDSLYESAKDHRRRQEDLRGKLVAAFLIALASVVLGSWARGAGLI